MEFENSELGKCVILKENNTCYSLIYSIRGKQFIVAYGLNKETGDWINGHYFLDDFDDALSFINETTQEKNEDKER